MANYSMIFGNTSSAAIYFMELKGQISDGKYENYSPANHWEWICKNYDYSVGTNLGGVYPYRRYSNYTLREWPGYITRANSPKATENDLKYAWAERVLFYGGFARIIKPEDVAKLDNSNLEILIETLGWYLKYTNNISEFTFEKFVDYIKENYSWKYKYMENAPLFTKENVEEYVKHFGEYTVNDLRNDLKLLKVTLNTNF